VLTAEGRFDQQSFSGKAPVAVAARSRAANVPCIVIAGQVERGLTIPVSSGVTEVYSLCSIIDDALLSTQGLLRDRTCVIVKKYIENQ
jgi:glycerate kinase